MEEVTARWTPSITKAGWGGSGGEGRRWVGWLGG